MSAKERRAYEAGLRDARAYLIAAPTLTSGQRQADMTGGVPRIMDRARDPDGDPNFVVCTYALRDAVLFWIDRDLAEASIDGSNV